MPYPKEPQGELSNTYFVQDRSNQEEMARLEIQDKMLTAGMGGVLPELADHSHLRKVLDVGCGTGGWLMETARTYPNIEKLVGVDISNKMVTYARTRTEAQQLDQRVQFSVMDALRILDFINGSFDLVNQRFGISWLRTWDWRKILVEYHRVTRPGGIIRITESNLNIESNSPALTKLNSIGLTAWRNSGRVSKTSENGITDELAGLMTQHKIQDVKTRLCTLVFRAGTIEGQSFYEDMQHGFSVGLPFFQKWTNVPSDYQQIYQQALQEMQQPDFTATWTLLTAWGNKPKDGAPLLMRGLL